MLGCLCVYVGKQEKIEKACDRVGHVTLCVIGWCLDREYTVQRLLVNSVDRVH